MKLKRFRTESITLLLFDLVRGRNVPMEGNGCGEANGWGYGDGSGFGYGKKRHKNKNSILNYKVKVL